MKKSFKILGVFLILGASLLHSCKFEKEGCTDLKASNYDINATNEEQQKVAKLCKAGCNKRAKQKERSEEKQIKEVQSLGNQSKETACNGYKSYFV